MKIIEVCQYLETIAPKHLQESYDNAGLIVGDPSTTVSGVLVCLDSIESIVEEAVAKKCNLIVAHHPIIFAGLKQINGKNYVERTVIKAIQHKVAIYAIHTNLDNVLYKGVNGMIAKKIGLQKVDVLLPKKRELEGNIVGSGVLGYLPKPMDELDFLKDLKRIMQVGCLKYTRLIGRPVSKVAVCGGSGSFLLRQAIKQEADVFVTADFKYHEFFDANDRIVIADIGHYESEQYTIELLTRILSEKFSTFAIHSTKHNTNPVLYL